MQDFLLAIDNFLFPEYAVPAFQLETELGSIHQPYSDILHYKGQFANGIANTVQSILDHASGSNAAPPSVINKILQELQIRLSNAYTFDAIGHLDLITQVDLSASFPDAYLHGQAEGAIWDDGSGLSAELPVFSISPANIKLSKGSSNSELVFLFSTKQGKLQKVFPITFNYKINKIEHNIEKVKIKNSTIPVGEWLSFVLPFEETEDLNLKIPIPLRDFPQSPALPKQEYLPYVTQFGSAAVSPFKDEKPVPSFTTSSLEEAKAWRYEFAYKYLQASQDTLNIGLKTSAPVTTHKSQVPVLGYDLLDALIQFQAVHSGIKADLDKFLVQKKGTNANTMAAVRSFAFIINRVLKAYKEWPTDKLNYEKNVTINENFDINVSTAAEYQVEVAVRKGQTSSLTPPIVILNGYVANHIIVDGVRLITYTDLKTNTPLTLEKGELIAERSIRFDEDLFDILSKASATGNISITRNEELVKAYETNPAFLYQSPQIEFVNPIHPILAPSPHNLPLYLTNDGGKPKKTIDGYKLDNLLANFFMG
ncbi:MAG: hypothetical protein JKY48_16820 [Flavobacteriales bacterium]|nr:hypothetical protein [Flavobacteriales bacterium]